MRAHTLRCGINLSGPVLRRRGARVFSGIDATASNVEEASTAEGVLEFGLACTQGPRDDMEDELCVIPNFNGSLYAAVFDGHSGVQAATWLHDNLQEYIAPALAQASSHEHALQAAFSAADSDLLEHLTPAKNNGSQSFSHAGATASVALITADSVTSANIGDSSVVLCRRGRDVLLSEVHRVYGSEPSVKAEVARVEAAGGWVSSDGRVCDMIAVSRAFGDWEFKGPGLPKLLKEGASQGWWDDEFAASVRFTADPVIAAPSVSTTPVSAEAGDEFLVIASDGLWDFYKQADAIRFARMLLQRGAKPQEVADSLVDRALKRYTSDNVAVIVVTFPWGLYSEKKKKKRGLFGLL